MSFKGGMGIYRGRRFQPYLSLNTPEDLTCEKGVNDCQTIGWTGISGFKASYQISKDGVLLVDEPWMAKNIYYDLPSDLDIGSHEFTLTVYDLVGQSISDAVIVIVKTPTTITTITTVTVTVFEFMVSLGIQGVLVISLTTGGLLALFKRKKLRI